MAGVKISRQTGQRLKKLLDPESNRRDHTAPGGGGTTYIPSGGEDPRVVIVVEGDISPNSWGKFKFTTGAKGSETTIGDAYDGFYRNEDVGPPTPPDLPEGTKCLLLWIASSEPDEEGWELFPLSCLE